MGLSSNYLDFPHSRKSPFYGDGDRDTDVEILGDSLGTGQLIFWGYIVVYPQNSPFFGDGDGVRAVHRFGDNLGAGKTKILGIFGGKSPKIPKF